MELADTSVWARKSHPAVKGWFDSALVAGQLAVCDMVVLELLHSASRPEVYARVQSSLDAIPWLQIGATEWKRAREVYRLLSDLGGAAHRSVKPADLLIAAAAEAAEVGLVHYDRDYDLIAKVTGQPARWLAPRGSL